MTVSKALATLGACAVVFAAVGGLVGCVLGLVAPGYYRNVFLSGQQADFDPVQVGLGLGITQGLTLGVIAGLVIVVSVAWHSSRKAN